MEGEHLVIAPNTLIFFVDESGDETLGNPDHPVFAFGGVGCVVEHLQAIRRDWSDMKSSVFPQLKGPFHAKVHVKGHRYTDAKRLSLLAAMSHPGLARFGFTLTTDTMVERDKTVEVACRSLTLRFEAIANDMIAKGFWNPPGPALMIFEHSARLANQIEAYLGEVRYHVDGEAYSFNGGFMPKESADPMLEMADFVAWSIGGNVKYQMERSREVCTPTFDYMFRKAKPAMASYMEAKAATFEPAAA
jgi:Protein of unknown function (DUF3800)